MKDRILAELKRVEQEYGVRVLLAVESGSRAWGFSSPDSDYDVRFIYVHRRDWYVSVFESRDVIEEMLPGDLDLSGWDLRKALRLLSKCNLTLNEWLGSPVTYHEVGPVRRELLDLQPQFFNPIAAIHHYRSMATHALEENHADSSMGIKKLFYVLRPLLACRWIERLGSQPPTAFAELLTAELVTIEEREWIEQLLKKKASAGESDRVELPPSRAAGIRAELERYNAVAPQTAASARPAAGALDKLLRTWCLSSADPG